MNILVTGGAGYIGSHTCLELLQAGHQVICYDNLSNASKQSVQRVEKLTGVAMSFYGADIRDRSALDAVFQRHRIDAVIHFAGLKAVGESVEQPIAYYDNNVRGTLTLCQAMAAHNCKNLVFSSSATVYGQPETVPIREDSPVGATNPYGRSKLIIEQMLEDITLSDDQWHVALLRYFNPVGAHCSGCIGEDPRGIPNNLLPFVAQVAVGKRDCLRVFGGDYPTVDGTGVRDYIHVVDLARGHICALNALSEHQLLTVNLGTGHGYSVLEVVRAFEAASGCQVPYQIVARRPGDIAICYADTHYAEKVLRWRAEYDLNRMCADAWRWQSANPNGYEDGCGE
ncbi:MAG: UDP-glucose 4-epimerase GalE [Desulfuromonadaceae bacterium]|nr:UDP-glucose 4-epimerase GalE [Desulfuromonadaceae bacterium]